MFRLGASMINLIGAYIFTLLLAAVLKERRRLSTFCAKLDRMPTWGRLSVVALLACLAVGKYSGGRSILPFALLDHITFLMHEAGHSYFCWCGPLLHSLGGTINEILFPALLALWGHRRGFVLTQLLALYWIGFNALGIGQYMADARVMQIDLVGVGREGHDWHNIFEILGLLEFDVQIGTTTRYVGGLIIAATMCLIIRPWIIYEPRPRE